MKKDKISGLLSEVISQNKKDWHSTILYNVIYQMEKEEKIFKKVGSILNRKKDTHLDMLTILTIYMHTRLIETADLTISRYFVSKEKKILGKDLSKHFYAECHQARKLIF